MTISEKINFSNNTQLVGSRSTATPSMSSQKAPFPTAPNSGQPVQGLSGRVSVAQPFSEDFSSSVEACTFTNAKGSPIGKEEAFQTAVSMIQKVKAEKGTVYVVASRKDQSASHFTTDLMKGLETASQTLTYDSPELKFLYPEDLVVFADYSPELLTKPLRTRTGSVPQIITLSERNETHLGEVNFSIEKSINPVTGNMMRMYILHTIVDLCQLPTANATDRRAELNASVTTECSHTDRNGNLMSAAESTEISQQLLERVRAQRGTVYVVGNGGSDQIASDTKDQLLKKGILAKTLTGNSCLTTCLSNDKGYPKVFSDQLEKLLKPQDLVIAISSSGASPNILAVAEEANKKNVPVITLSGFKADNPLRKKGDVNIFINKKDYGLVEVGHFYLLYNLLDTVNTQATLSLAPKSSKL
jgi:D-sedoheptulose 7-phosphate isomerase